MDSIVATSEIYPSQDNKTLPTQCSAGLLFILGTFVLCVWHIPALMETFPFAATMAYNTAFSMILLSICIFSLVKQKLTTVKVACMIIFLLSGFTIIESYFGISVGLHYWFTQFIAPLPPLQSKMSPTTASCLLLASISLALSSMAPPSNKNYLLIVVVFLNVMVCTIATITLLGSSIGLIPAFGWLGVKMAPHTAIGLIIFSTTMIFYVQNYAVATFNRLKFFYRILTGFGFMVVLVTAIGTVAVMQIKTVSAITQELYKNPVQVNNAVTRIKLEINAINRNLKNIAIKPSIYPHHKIPDDMKQMKMNILKDIHFIRENEPLMIKDISDFERGFFEWEKFVYTLYELLDTKDYVTYEQRAVYSGQEQIFKLEEILENIAVQAQTRMAALNNLVISAKDDAKNLVFIILAAFLLVALIVSMLITQSLTTQLDRIRHLMLDIAHEKLGQTIPFLDHPQEIGDMARTLAIFEENMSARRQLEKRLRQVIEAAPNGMIMINTARKIEIVNAQAEKIFGYNRNDLLGKSVEQLIPQTVAEDHPNYRNKLFENPSSITMETGREVIGLRKDGSEFPMHIGLAPIEADDGTKVLAAFEDITERRKIAAALNSSRELLELTTRINQIGVWEYIQESDQLIWNDAMFDIYGRNKSLFTHNHSAWQQCVHPDDLKKTEKTFQESINTLTPYAAKFRIILPDGSIKHLHAKATIERVGSSTALRILGTNTDITREELAFEKIHKLEMLRSSIVEFSEDGIISKTLYGIITSWNTGATNMFGYTANEAIGQSIRDLLFPEDRRNEEEMLLSKLRTDLVVLHFETIHRHKDGRLLNVSITHSPIADAIGNTVGISVIYRDITESIKARELLSQRQHALEKSHADLDRSNKELETFAYVASHDLKSPLRGIAQLSSWIEEDLVVHDYTAVNGHTLMLRNRIHRMEKLLDDLLIFYRAGKTVSIENHVNVREMAQEIFEIQNTKPKLRLDTTSDLPVFFTFSTPLEQVLRNLFSNAIKHHDLEEGLIQLSCRDLDDDFYAFSVADDGPGIPKKFQERIFGMFQTLKPRDELEGSGMGLALIKKIVENYGGKITLTSTGRGCCFHFSWPKKIKRMY